MILFLIVASHLHRIDWKNFHVLSVLIIHGSELFYGMFIILANV